LSINRNKFPFALLKSGNVLHFMIECSFLFMAALRIRCGHYIFALWFLSFFLSFFIPGLILAVADWMSTIHGVVLVQI